MFNINAAPNSKMFSVLDSMANITYNNCNKNNATCYSYIYNDRNIEYCAHLTIEEATNYLMAELFEQDLQQFGSIDTNDGETLEETQVSYRLSIGRSVSFNYNDFCVISDKIYVVHLFKPADSYTKIELCPIVSMIGDVICDDVMGYESDDFQFEALVIELSNEKKYKKSISYNLPNGEICNLIVSVDMY